MKRSSSQSKLVVTLTKSGSSERANQRTGVFVLVEKTHGVADAKVLKVQEGIGELFAGGSDEAVDELVVLFSSQARVAPPEVELGVEQLLVVGANVETDAENFGGVDACAECVNGSFACEWVANWSAKGSVIQDADANSGLRRTHQL